MTWLNKSNFNKHLCTSTLALALFFTLTYLHANENEKIFEVKSIVQKLASAEFEGREATTKGNAITTEYLIKTLETLNIKPFKNSYKQTFHLSKLSRVNPEKTKITVTLNGKENTYEKTTIAIGHFKSPVDLELPIAFAGYGITNQGQDYNDFESLDVKDKAILIFRFDPTESKNEKYQPWSEAFLNFKLATARKNGAKAIILVNGPHSLQSKKEPFTQNNNKLSINELSSDIPYIQVDSSFLDLLPPPENTTWSDIQKEIDLNKKPLKLNWSTPPIVKLKLDFYNNLASTENIIAYIEGQDETLKNEFIVVGAHYDHVGFGHFGSRIGKKGNSLLHPGADDNASGVAATLRIIKETLALKENKRSMLFVFFAAEEKGLFGSQYFVKNPIVPLNQIRALINLDMVGYYREDVKLYISGSYTCSQFIPILEKHKGDLLLDLSKVDPAFGPSDHANFAQENIPCMHFFTNLHDNYHSPTDTPEKLNYEGLIKIADLAQKTALDLANTTEPIKWDTNFKPLAFAHIGIRVVNHSDERIKVLAIEPFSPAAKAGLQVNDIIVKMGFFNINYYIDFASVLRDLTVNSTLNITISRKNGDKWEEHQLTLQL